MMPGEKYRPRVNGVLQNYYITNEVYNPCYDITCPNMDCYDHPYNGKPPCKNPNCGNKNCKRTPCKWNGSDLGLG